MDAQGYYNRGESKPLEEAIADYTKAIELNPNFLNAYKARGNAFLSLNILESALEDIIKAMDLDPFDEDLWCSLAHIKESTLKGSGKTFLNHSYFLTAVKLYLKNDSDGAFNYLTDIINWCPTHSLSYYYRGLCSEEEGDYQLALEDYSKAIVTNPNFGEAYNRRGRIYSELGLDQLALEDYSKAAGIERMFPYP